MRVSSLKYQFYAFIDPARYDTFNIKCAKGLEAMVQTYIDSGSPFLKLYMKISRPDETPRASTSILVQETRTVENVDSPMTQLCVSGFDINFGQWVFNTWNTYMGMASTSRYWQSTNDSGCFNNYTRRDDVLLTTSTGEGTSSTIDVGGFENEDGNEFNTGPVREPDADISKFTLFSKLDHVATELKDGEEGEDVEEDPRFTMYSPPTHMHNVNLSIEDGLEFAEIPYRRPDNASSSLDLGDLEVGKEFSTKDDFCHYSEEI
ncbi:hypothetical protein J1N35_037723 [Gossypium stocksii]|uniref:Uncharacterized protein n=1 Tax=Gossypium stocksii TaxID=47602 RepID=A0A9D3ZLY8_9ROSI|nr:hypothetical protein J1N35_037723 [Gossypium stocksii]